MSTAQQGITLAADIGGTKCLFGAFDGTECIAQRRLASADFPNFVDALEVALAELGQQTYQRACLALAGPIADGGRSARITNLPWQVDATALEKRFGLPPLVLVNDFAAAAMGAVSSASSQRVELQAGNPLPDAPHLVIGAGTGLGMAIVLADKNGWRIIPGEGGHVAFAPADEEQLALWQALHAEYGRVTWERVASGPGLKFIYRFICERDGQSPTLRVEDLAQAPADSSAARAINLFLRCYGAYAGDMAMTVLARGGVHLAGGIAAHLQSHMSSGSFTTAFKAKAEHVHLAKKMPIHICIDPALGLHGAAMLADTNS